MIRIHNSLTGEKQPLTPITPGEVRMYVCGLTVYDFMHIGHARMMLVFDVVKRYLRHRGLRVTHVRNITDIDDKIIKRAAENGEPIGASGLRQIHELVQQLRGTAGPRQVPGAPRVGYSQLYGAPGTAGVAIVSR